MVKLLIGALAGAVAMFVVGAIFYASPLGMLAYGWADAAQSVNIQAALAQNLGQGTGTYIIPNFTTPEGTVLYGKGPVAVVHYNALGFSTSDASAMLAGFIHEIVVALLLAFALYGIAGRVTDFASRARLVVLFALAAGLLMHVGQPIWMHQDWGYALYAFVADSLMLIAAGLVIARWFLPRPAPVA